MGLIPLNGYQHKWQKQREMLVLLWIKLGTFPALPHMRQLIRKQKVPISKHIGFPQGTSDAIPGLNIVRASGSGVETVWNVREGGIRALSMDQREHTVRAGGSGRPMQTTARCFAVCPKTVQRLVGQQQHSGSIAPRPIPDLPHQWSAAGDRLSEDDERFVIVDEIGTPTNLTRMYDWAQDEYTFPNLSSHMHTMRISKIGGLRTSP